MINMLREIVSAPGFWMGFVLSLVVIGIGWTLHRRDKDRLSRINLEGFLVDPDGTMNREAAVTFVALLVTSWIVIFQAFKGTLTEGTFGAYCLAWVAPTLARLYRDRPKPEPVVVPPGPATLVEHAERVTIRAPDTVHTPNPPNEAPRPPPGQDV